ncbi:MAG: hypothetical protein SGCHY_003024 [Lobulomycetales sp.]
MLAGIKSEAQSKNFTVWGQWVGLLSILLLLAVGIFTLISDKFLFAIAGFAEAGLLLFLEIPILMRCCPVSDRCTSVVNFFEAPRFRVVLYALFATFLWLSLLIGPSALIAPALTLSICFVLYLVAVVKGEGLERSEVLKGPSDRAVARYALQNSVGV